MTDYPAGFVTARGEEYPCYVTDGGGWYAFLTVDQKVYGNSKDALATAMSLKLRKAAAKINVPFTVRVTGRTVGSFTIRDGFVYSKHSGNGNLMVEWADGSKEQISSYGGLKFLPPLEAEEQLRWLELLKAESDAAKALAAFERQHDWPNYGSLARAVDRAIEGAAAEEAKSDA